MGSEPKKSPERGGKLGFRPPTQILYKQSMFECFGGKIQQNDEEFVKFKPFLCREAIEEASFGGHFGSSTPPFSVSSMLHQVPETEKNTTESIRDQIDVILIHVLSIED
jgi:hypothetical protein